MRALLWLGVFVPILYFGSQLAAARFYPGYSFRTQSASELGSDRSERPAVLNTGAKLTGIATLLAALAFPYALRRAGSPAVLAWITAAAMLSTGAGALWAGTFPLPDPRHNPRMIGAGAFLLPLLFLLATLRRRGALRIYLVANFLLFAAMIPVMSGITAIDVNANRGVLQRIAAAALYLPIGVVAASFLTSRAGTSASAPASSPGARAAARDLSAE